MIKMIKEKGIWYTIKFYDVIPFGIVGILLLIFYNPLYDFVLNVLKISKYSTAKSLIQIALPFVLIVVFIFFVFLILRDKIYTYKTGRNFRKDNGKYKRTYGELVEYFKDAEPQRMDLDKLPEMTWHDSGGIIYGKINGRLISYEPDGNGTVACVWGTPGVGKTRTVIVTSCRQFGGLEKIVNSDGSITYIQHGSVMVLDLKGDIYKLNKNYRNIKRFTTIFPDESWHYDPLVTARKMNDEDRAEFLDNLAVTLIPITSEKETEYFAKVGRSFFTAIFLLCLHEDNNRDFVDICKDITLHSFKEWGYKIETSGYELAMKYSNRFAEENDTNVGGGFSKLCECLLVYTTGTLSKLLVNDGHCISPDDLENCTDIYIQVDPQKLDVHGPLVALLFEVFMGAAYKREEGANPPLAYIIDEFGQLPNMPIIEKSAMLMRAYNSSLVICCQSIASLDRVYGPNTRKILVDCAKTHCFLSINDPDTRAWGSELVGSHKVLKISNSLNFSKTDTHSKSVSEAREKIIEPENFSVLPDDHSVLIWQQGHFVKAETCYYKS